MWRDPDRTLADHDEGQTTCLLSPDDVGVCQSVRFRPHAGGGRPAGRLAVLRLRRPPCRAHISACLSLSISLPPWTLHRTRPRRSPRPPSRWASSIRRQSCAVREHIPARDSDSFVLFFMSVFILNGRISLEKPRAIKCLPSTSSNSSCLSFSYSSLSSRPS